MADQTLLDFISGPVMTEYANAPIIRRGLPYVLPDVFRTPAKPIAGAPLVGDKIKFKKYNGDRTLPPIIAQKSTSPTLEVPGSTWEYATAIGGKGNFVVEQEMLYAMMSGNPYVQGNAVAEFQKRMDDFRAKFENLRTSLIHSMLLTGYIYAGTQTTGTYTGATVQTSSTNATITVVAGGTNQSLSSPLTSVGPQTFTTSSTWSNGGGITVGDWSSASTNIEQSLRAMKKGYIKTSGYMPSLILYGQNIPSYFAANTEMQSYMSRNQVIGRKFQDTNEIPPGMLDFDWVPAYNAYFQDANGSLLSWLGPDQIVILPSPDETWYEFVEAGTLIPTGIQPAGAVSVESLMGSNVKPAFGKYAYATMRSDPLILQAIMGDYFLPLIKNNLVQWIATVK